MSRIVIISVDMGVELAALDATREAVAAHLESSVSGFPPFADKRHEPQYDLLVPDEANWHVQLAFALFWHLQTGELQLDGDGRFTYQGIVLGQTYHEAAAALTAETGRVAGLPTLEQLDRQVRDLLHRDGQPLELLHSLEESLTEQLNDLHANASSTTPAEPKWRFALVQARSVARALARKLKARRRDVEVLLRARGKGLAEKTDDNGARLDEDNEDDQAFRRAK
jgi:hypothetical protein